VLHAFDAANEGDGYLVSETVALLHRVGVPAGEIRIVALNAESFNGLAEVRQYPVLKLNGAVRWDEFPRIGALAASSMVHRRLVGAVWPGEIGQCRLAVGVGGGYLQARGGKRSFDSALAHLPQLALAAGLRCPTVYLPQSVGPLMGPVGRVMRRHLARVDTVMLRDDKSTRELGGSNTIRRPDLAVLAIAREYDRGEAPRGLGGRIYGIARGLADAADYELQLGRLGRLCSIDWAVHSAAAGQNDLDFYDRMGLESVGPSRDVIASPAYGLCISVRLHGALQSMLAGVPTIHLSYERKGFGAYEDLGVGRWVHNARTFDAGIVAAQAAELLADPRPFWDAVESKLDGLRRADDDVARVLSCALG
jgi:polysaccharide pyruvyl transferase WcaK-like protein